jgi:hypothetical protein
MRVIAENDLGQESAVARLSDFGQYRVASVVEVDDQHIEGGLLESIYQAPECDEVRVGTDGLSRRADALVRHQVSADDQNHPGHNYLTVEYPALFQAPMPPATL